MSSTINSTSQPGAATSQVVARCRFCIPKPRSLAKFIIFPSLWRLPNINNPSALFHRIKNNLLYFQTNYLIISLVFFAIFTIFSMKTLLTGVVSATAIVVAVLFFFEHIPQARQIKQNYPTLVIIGGIALVFVAWHALHTILIVVAAAFVPLPLCLFHAATRSPDNLLSGTNLGKDSFINTPMGHIMQMVGIDPHFN